MKKTANVYQLFALALVLLPAFCTAQVKISGGSGGYVKIGVSNGITLTTTGSSGPATLTGDVLNIPQYQGSLTLTTTGTSGAATLVGDTLNIPQYAGGVSSLNSLTGALNLTSSDSSVSITPSGTSIDLTTAGGGGNIASDAVFAFAGTSIVADDNATQSPAITVTWTCDGTTCTFTNTGDNGLAAGDWVGFQHLSSWFAAPAPYSYGTGYTLFQVLASGLSATQFKIAYTLNTGSCASSCGDVHNAKNDLPFKVTGQPNMPANAWANTYVYLDGPASVQGLAADYTGLWHSVSPAVTGHPGYFTITDPWNDIKNCRSVAQIEADYQTVFAAANADGWKIVIPSIIGEQTTQQYGAGFCSFPAPPYYEMVQLDKWLRIQQQTIANTTQYWTYYVDLGRTYNDPLNSSLVYGSPTAWQLWGQEEANCLYAGACVPKPNVPLYFGNAQDAGGTAENGYITVPSGDSLRTFQWLNSDMTKRVLAMETDTGATNSNNQAFISDELTISNPDTTQKITLDINNTHNDVGVYGPGFRYLQTFTTPDAGNTGTDNIYGYIAADTNANGGFHWGWANPATDSATANAAFLHVFGDTKDSIRACTGGELSVGMATVFTNGNPTGCISGAMFSVGPTGQFKVDSSGNTALAGCAAGSVLKADGTGCTTALPSSVPSGCLQYPCLAATANLTGQTNNVASALLYTVPTGQGGLYKADCYEVVTTAATTSSTLPNCQLASWTDPDSGVLEDHCSITGNTTANTVGTTFVEGYCIVNLAAGGTIYWRTGNYASSGATAMAYAAHLRLTYVGP